MRDKTLIPVFKKAVAMMDTGTVPNESTQCALREGFLEKEEGNPGPVTPKHATMAVS